MSKRMILLLGVFLYLCSSLVAEAECNKHCKSKQKPDVQVTCGGWSDPTIMSISYNPTYYCEEPSDPQGTCVGQTNGTTHEYSIVGGISYTSEWVWKLTSGVNFTFIKTKTSTAPEAPPGWTVQIPFYYHNEGKCAIESFNPPGVSIDWAQVCY